jgi:hypothetical protein
VKRSRAKRYEALAAEIERLGAWSCAVGDTPPVIGAIASGPREYPSFDQGPREIDTVPPAVPIPGTLTLCRPRGWARRLR